MYDRKLRTNVEVKRLIAQECKSNSSATVEQRFQSVRRAISCWNKENHRNSQKAVEDARRKLDSEMSKSTADETLIYAINAELSSAERRR
ncbi:unnamed protein product [Arabis nemorensis]|uniref:Uncharacterized protein n=1 Tax=Arabis nemorensis TaxID=586526 RepID=A0A565AR03_9BRAS|nr:unnamed protein product [Arabis nemorensis]